MKISPDSTRTEAGDSSRCFFRNPRRLAYAMMLVLSVALTSCSQPTESASIGTSIEGSAEHVIVGEASLEERVYYADVIVRGKLKSTSTSTEPGYRSTDTDKRYQGLVHFVFDVHEYIRGTGGPELSVVATVNLRSDVIREIIEFSAKGEFIDLHGGDWRNPYTTEALALEAAKEWEQARDRRWDDREALILAREVDATSDDSKRYSLGQIFSYSIGGINTVWLPLAEDPDAIESVPQNGTDKGDEARFLLKVPESSSATGASGSADVVLETITIPELKAVMARLEQWRKDGEGVEGHEYCIHSSFIDKRRVNEAKERGETTYVRSDRSMESGTPAGTALIATHTLDGNVWLEGTGAEVFEVAPYSNGVIRTQRPLHGGVFRYFWNRQGSTYIPCGYLPDNAQNTIEHFVTVTAPEGVIHEAFFDPVAIGDAVGADATNGQLKPVEFDVEGGGTRSISSIEWEDGEVTMVLSSSAPSDGYDLDFIGLDGNVTLSLLGAEATVSGGTITWDVATQPWNDGDLLMLRMRAAAPPVPTPTPDPSVPTPTPTPIPTDTPTPVPTNTPTPVPADTPTPVPTDTPTPVPTDTPTPIPTDTPTPVPTNTPTPVPTDTPTPVPTDTPTPVPADTPTPAPLVPTYECDIVDVGTPTAYASYNGTVEVGDCYDGAFFDFYSFTLDDEDEIQIDLESDDFDPFLRILSGRSKTGEILEEHDDVDYHGGNTNARITTTLPAGDYTILVLTVNLNTTGNYTLTISDPNQPTPTPTPAPTALP